MRLKLPRDYVIQLTFRALWPWSYIKLYKYATYKHLVWGKISLIFGQPDLMEISCCAYCCGDVQECYDVSVCVGDGECGIVEGNVLNLTIKEWEQLNGN